MLVGLRCTCDAPDRRPGDACRSISGRCSRPSPNGWSAASAVAFVAGASGGVCSCCCRRQSRRMAHVNIVAWRCWSGSPECSRRRNFARPARHRPDRGTARRPRVGLDDLVVRAPLAAAWMAALIRREQAEAISTANGPPGSAPAAAAGTTLIRMDGRLRPARLSAWRASTASAKVAKPVAIEHRVTPIFIHASCPAHLPVPNCAGKAKFHTLRVRNDVRLAGVNAAARTAAAMSTFTIDTSTSRATPSPVPGKRMTAPAIRAARRTAGPNSRS